MNVTREEIVTRLYDLEQSRDSLALEINAASDKLYDYDLERSLWKIGQIVQYTETAYYHNDRGKKFVIRALEFDRDTGEIKGVWGVRLRLNGTPYLGHSRPLYDRKHLELIG